MAEQQPTKGAPAEQGGFRLVKPRVWFYGQDLTGADGRGRTWLIKACKVVIPPLCRLLYKLEARGTENIPPREEGPVVFVGNHVSYMDPVVLWVAAQPHKPRFLARSNLWRIPVFGGLLCRIGAIPVDPESADLKAVKTAAAALKRGEDVGIFAEGTRMRTPDKVYKPHAGFVLIANMGKAKVVPVGIAGADRIKPFDKKGLHFPKITVSFGPAIDLASYKELPKAERTDTIVRDVMREVFALRDAADPAPIRPGLPPYGQVEDKYLEAE
ncbi:MAG: lysophospholipid acyltransferase family protein [Coriobacteriales bacterium]